MSNQKTSQLRLLTAASIAGGDLLPIVDSSEVTSPTGETKHTTVTDFVSYVVNDTLALKRQAIQSANGLNFVESVVPSGNNERCYGKSENLNDMFTISVSGFVPQDIVSASYGDRVFLGMGTSNIIVGTNNSAYIGISDYDLVAKVTDPIGNSASVVIPQFFNIYTDIVFSAALTKDISGEIILYVNGDAMISSSNAALTPLTNTVTTMGNGATGGNIKCTIYEAHTFSVPLYADDIRSMFFRGVDSTDANLVSSYNSRNLNVGPTQWLDSVGDNHLLLPINGAQASSPEKRFTLAFYASASGYLGDGSARDVLPGKYMLTSCIVESSGKPLLSIGSSNMTSSISSSGTGSFYDNRVALVSASYGVNPLNMLALGVGHADKSIYVYFSSSAAPCTFSFDGYVRN